MPDEELERLKNTNIDFGKIVKAASEVNPATGREREATGLKSLVGQLGAAVYLTTIQPFGPAIFSKVKTAISAVHAANAADNPFHGKVSHVVMLAEMLLADLNAVPTRKAGGAVSLTTECESLAKMLPE